jgi:hypothetical protein
MHSVPRQNLLRAAFSRTLPLVALILLAFSSLPAFANHSPTNAQLYRTTPALNHKGLPCSTPSNGALPAATSDSGLRQLNAVERQSLNLPKTAPAPRNPALNRSTQPKPEKQVPIEFVYHAPSSRH